MNKRPLGRKLNGPLLVAPRPCARGYGAAPHPMHSQPTEEGPKEARSERQRASSIGSPRRTRGAYSSASRAIVQRGGPARRGTPPVLVIHGVTDAAGNYGQA